MNVLMFGWEYPPHISGGLGTACQGLVRGFGSYEDVNITLIVPRTYGDEDNFGLRLISASDIELTGERIRNILSEKGRTSVRQLTHYSAYSMPGKLEQAISEKVVKSGITKEKIVSGKVDFTGQYTGSLFDEVSWYGLVGSEIASREKFDVIHAHDWLTFPAGIEARKVSGKPLVVHVHATEFDRSGTNNNQRIFEIEKKGMQAADMVIAVSNFTRNTIIKHYKIDPAKVVTIHNAVEAGLPAGAVPGHEDLVKDRVVTFLGRITWQKGPEYFAQAACRVLRKMGNIRFVMAGSGDLMGKMMNYVSMLKIADRFHFTGFLKGPDVYKMYSISDLFIMPSVSEPFGISPLEALQCDVPVIISKQSGVSEVITHAIKVDFWDIDALADYIYAILNYPALSDHLRLNGRNDINKLKWTDAAAKVKDIYYRVAYRIAG